MAPTCPVPDGGSPALFGAVPIRDLLFADWGRPMLMLPSASTVLYDWTIMIVPSGRQPRTASERATADRSMLQYSVQSSIREP